MLAHSHHIVWLTYHTRNDGDEIIQIWLPEHRHSSSFMIWSKYGADLATGLLWMQKPKYRTSIIYACLHLSQFSPDTKTFPAITIVFKLRQNFQLSLNVRKTHTHTQAYLSTLEHLVIALFVLFAFTLSLSLLILKA